MNMFSGIQQVDEHVKRLLNISKNVDDIDVQCHTISKLYFDINEFGIAKSYIERYLKAKSNSESGLLLKAKIHEKLNEFTFALNTYETLYNISNKENYIRKACECLLNAEVSDQKAKFWIALLESEDQDTKLLVDLKIKYFGTFEASVKELENLEYKMKNDSNNQVKRQYLAILERIPISDTVFTKCINLINSYPVFDDVNIVKTCVKIIEKSHPYSNDPLYKPIYCILLISLLKNRIKTSEYDCTEYLAKLYDLLKDVNNDIFVELKCQFLYHFLSFAHSLAIKTMTTDIASCLYKGYICLQSANKPISDKCLPENLSTWLNHQIIYRRSVTNHMCILKRDLPILPRTIKDSITTVANIVWPSTIENYKDLYKLFTDSDSALKVSDQKLIDCDIECHVGKKMDFQLIMWQLMNHLYESDCNVSQDLEITDIAASFVNSFLGIVFSKLPMRATHNRCPENISKTDLVTFLLGAALTYKKSSQNIKHLLPIPFEYLVENVRVIDTLDKWWQAVNDFLLNNKRNTSIGAMREFFKKGLEIIQAVDCKVPESLKFQLGRSLAKFTNACSLSDYDNDALLERSIAFLYSTINENKTQSLSKAIPITSFSSQTSLIRQNNINSPFNKNQTIVLFDTDNAPKEIIEKWCFEAYLSYIDWKLKRDNIGDDYTLFDLHDLVDIAESMNKTSPSLYLVKSRMYVALARRSIESNESERFNDYLSKATDCITRGQQYVTVLPKTDRYELAELFDEQILTIENLKTSENSLLNFTCADESSNNIDMLLGQTNFSDSSLPNDGKLKNGPTNIRLENDIALMDVFNEHVEETISQCLDRVEDNAQQSQENSRDILLLKLQTDLQNDMYSDLFTKFETLHRQYISFSTIENNYEQISTENKVLKLQIEGLVNTVCDLEKKNIDLEMKLNRMDRSSMVQSKLGNLSQIIDSSLMTAQTKVQGHLQYFDKVEASIMNLHLIQQSGKKSISPKSDLKTVKEGIKNRTEVKDLIQLTYNKWQCQSCLVNNDNSVSVCACCSTTKSNPNSAKKDSQFPASIDLSRFTLNKWQCPTCMNTNDNSMDKCPSCYADNPNAPKTGTKPDSSSTKITFGSSQKETRSKINGVDMTRPATNADSSKKDISSMDLSRFTLNKWQCSTCLNSNDNSMIKCPSCDTANPANKSPTSNISFGSISKTSLFQKEASKITFGSNSNLNPSGKTVVNGELGKPTLGFKFGVSSKPENITEESKIAFGTNSNQNIKVMTEPVSVSTVSENKDPMDKTESWICECTTRNSNDVGECIACGEKREEENDDDDSDVIFVSGPYVTEEQKKRARHLMLADHYYYYENMPGYEDKNDSEEEAVAEVTSQVSACVVAASGEKDEAEEEYDPQYQSIVDLPLVEVTTGDEGWQCVFSERCRLYRFVADKGWTERGLGDMKILSKDIEGKVSVRVIMRREIVNRICLNHVVQKSCPVFLPMEGGRTNSACWFANDFSEGTAHTKENFAVRFKTEKEMNEFKRKIGDLQSEMDTEREEE